MNGNTTLPAKSPGSGKHSAPQRLTPTEIRAAHFIERHRHSEGYSPSYRDVAEAVNVSPGGAYKLVRRLIDKGIVDKAAGKPRSLIVICELGDLEQAAGGAI